MLNLKQGKIAGVEFVWRNIWWKITIIFWWTDVKNQSVKLKGKS